jgi:hypothetical protein
MARLFYFSLVALLINKTRFIDIVNTVLLSQAPNFHTSIKYSGLETLANLKKPQMAQLHRSI